MTAYETIQFLPPTAKPTRIGRKNRGHYSSGVYREQQSFPLEDTVSKTLRSVGVDVSIAKRALDSRVNPYGDVIEHLGVVHVRGKYDFEEIRRLLEKLKAERGLVHMVEVVGTSFSVTSKGTETETKKDEDKNRWKYDQVIVTKG